MKKGQKVKVLNNRYSYFKPNEIVEFTGETDVDSYGATLYRFIGAKKLKQWLNEGDFLVLDSEYDESEELIAMVNFEGFSNDTTASKTYCFKTNLTDLAVGDTVIVDSRGEHQKANFLGYTNDTTFEPTKYIIKRVNKNKESLSHGIVFNPSKVDVVEDRIVLHFNEGGISIYVKGEIFHLVNSGSTMDIRIENKKVLNKDTFTFKSSTGRILTYHSMQVKALHGIKDLLDKIINESVNSDYYVTVKESTEKLFDEIMKFHKDNLVDKYLEERNFTALEKMFGELSYGA